MDAVERDEILAILGTRFAANTHRHRDVAWRVVEERIAADPASLRILAAMEATGGEPDVVVTPDAGGAIVFVDCAPESPSGRRSLCYDRPALEARKANRPTGSAVEAAAALGVALLTEAEYRALQALESFDRKTSSWIATPDPVRALGGALFCDRRYDRVFVYHNGADSYFAARGFRGRLVV